MIDPGRLSDELGGEAEFRAPGRRRARRRTGDHPRRRPQPHGGRRRQPLLGRSRRCGSSSSTSIRQTGRHRRFFDIDELAGVRQEDPEVFAATHELVLRLVREGLVDGLRVDHPDGLADPAGYLARLRERRRRARVGGEDPRIPASTCATGRCAGTVGYEFLNDVCALFVDPAGEAALTALWERVSGDRAAVRRGGARGQARAGRRDVPARARAAGPGAGDAAEVAGLERAGARGVLAAGVPDLRRPGRGESSTTRTGGRWPRPRMPDELREMLLLEREAPPEFVTRFQQTTPAIMAKGVEDTAFYRYAPAAGPQRRRRRSRAASGSAWSASTRPTWSARSASR